MSCSEAYTQCTGDDEVDYAGQKDPKSKKDKWEDQYDRGYLMLDSSYSFPCCGVITAWEFFVKKELDVDGDLHFQVWRPTSSSFEYRLMSEVQRTVLSDEAEKEILHILSLPEQQTVIPNDVMGWQASGEDIVPYKEGGGELDNNYIEDPMPDVAIGQTHTFNSGGRVIDRSYGIRAYLSPGTAPTLSNLPTTISISRAILSGNVVFQATYEDINRQDKHTFSDGGIAIGGFSVDAVSGQVSISGSVEPGEYKVRIRVTDTCGLRDQEYLTVIVLNSKPEITSLPASIDVHEDVAIETTLHYINVTDADGPSEGIECFVADSSPPTSSFLIKTVPTTLDHTVVLKANQHLSYDTGLAYTLTVNCTDDIDFDVDKFKVYLQRNDPPVFTNLPNSTTIPAKTTTIGDLIFLVLSYDSNNDQVVYTMSCTPTPCPFSISALGSVKATQSLRSETQTSYSMEVYVDDGKTVTGPAVLDIVLTDLNTAPVLTNLPGTVYISELAIPGFLVQNLSASDPDIGDIVTFDVIITPAVVGAQFFEFDSLLSAVRLRNNASLNYETAAATSFSFTVTASDGIFSSDSETLTVLLVDANEAPTFSASKYYITAQEGEKGSILPDAGFSVVDEDQGEIITFHISDGLQKEKFAIDSSTGQLSFAHDFDISGQSTETVVLFIVAEDREGLFDQTELEILIENVNQPPQFVNIPQTFSVSEATVTGSHLFAVDVWDDEPDDDLHYSLTFEPSGSISVFVFNESTRELSLSDGHVFDYESVPVHEITFLVSDGKLFSDPAILVINIVDVNEHPVFLSSLYHLTVPAGKKGMPIGDAGFQIEDEDIGDVMEYHIIGGSEAHLFSIDTTTGQLSLAADHEVLPQNSPETFIIQIEVSDLGGLTDNTTLKILIENVNQKPALLNLPHRLSVTEDTPGGTVLYTVNVLDDNPREALTFHYSVEPSTSAATYSFNQSTGQLYITPSYDLDFETTSVYNITFEVEDGDLFSKVASLVIDVTDVNESPVFAAATYYITVMEGEKGVVLPDPQFVVIDEDVDDELAFRIAGGPDADKFSVDSSSGILSFAKDFDIKDVDSPYISVVEVDVVDQGELHDRCSIEIRIENVNKKPTLLNLPQKLSLTEGTPAGTALYTVNVNNDSDLETLTFHLVVDPNTGGALFLFNQTSQKLSLTSGQQFDYESTSVYNVTFQVDDGELFSDTATLELEITDTNESPVFSSPAYHVTADEGPVGCQLLKRHGTSRPPAQCSRRGRWRNIHFPPDWGTHADKFSVDSVTGILLFADDVDIRAVDSPNRFDVELEVKDGGGLTSTTLVEILIENVNQKPALLNLPHRLSVTEDTPGGTVLYTVNVLDDNPREALTFHYSVEPSTGAATYSFNQSTGQLYTTPSYDLDFETTSVYNITFEVEDGDLFSKVASLVIDVTDVNESPVFAAATYYITVLEGEKGVVLPDPQFVVIDEDVDDEPAFRIAGGLDADKFSVDSSSGILSFAKDFDIKDVDSPYISVVEVDVVDQGGLSDRCSIEIRIENVNKKPTLLNLPQKLSLTEGTPAGTALYTVNVDNDSDLETLTFHLVVDPNTGGALFIFNQTSQKLSLAPGQQFDYESTPVYNVTFQVDDGELFSDTATLELEITDTNESPVFSSPAYHVTADEGPKGTVLPDLQLGVLDEDAGETFSFRLTGGTHADKFSVNSVTGILSFADDVDIQAEVSPARFDVELEVKDVGGLTSMTLVEILIENVNQKPALLNLPHKVSVTENTPGGTVLYTVNVLDDNPFEALTFHYSVQPSTGAATYSFNQSTGQLYITPSYDLDFETTSVYNITFEVEDGDLFSELASLVIDVTDVNESPVFAAATYYITVTEGEKGVVLPDPQFVVIDEDVDDELAFHIAGGPDADKFSVDSSSGILSFAKDFDIKDVDSPYISVVEVDVVDQGGLSDRCSIEIQIENVNKKPTLLNLPQKLSLTEGTPAGTALYTVNVDNDSDLETLTFHLVVYPNTGGALFIFNQTSQELFLAPDQQFDYESTSVYNVTFQVDDGELFSDTATLELEITNTNESPVFSSPAYHFTADEGPKGTVLPDLQLSVLDEDAGETFTFRLTGGTHADKFSVDSVTGILSFADDVDIRAVDSPARFDVQLEVKDVGGLTTTTLLEILIENVNQKPAMLNLPHRLSVTEDTPGETVLYTVNVLDDNPREALTFHYSVEPSTGAATYSFNQSTGQLYITPSYDLDFETTSVYNITFEVEDGDLFSEMASLVIDVTDVNESPVFAAATYYITVAEGEKGFFLPDPGFAVMDSDHGEMLTFKILIGPNSDKFAINPASGILSFATNVDIQAEDSPSTVTIDVGHRLDHEAVPVYNISFQVSDGELTSEPAVLIVEVTDVNEKPIFSTSVYHVTVAEGKKDDSFAVPLLSIIDEDMYDTVKYGILPGPATNRFSMAPTTGTLTFVSDYDVPPSGDTLTLTMEVEDKGGLTDRADMVIDIYNVNYAPEFTKLPHRIQIPEDTPPGTVLYHVGVQDDEMDAGLNYLLAFTPTSAVDIFHFNQSTGGVSIKPGMQLDYEVTEVYNITLTVVDTQLLSDTGSLVIEILDVSEAPAFHLPQYYVTTSEGKMGDMLPAVGFSVSDDDARDTVQFRISSGIEARRFSINTTTGRLSFASDYEILSIESPKTSILQVEARDSSGLTAQTELVITILNVNHKPYFTNLPQDISLLENLELGAVFYTGYVRDDDIVNPLVLLNYEPSTAASLFRFNESSGVYSLSIAVGLDYETLDLVNITFRCFDGELTSDPVVLSINILDVNERPVFSSPLYSLTALEGKKNDLVSDPHLLVLDDDLADTVSFRIIGGDQADKFSIDQSSGLLYYADDFDVGMAGLPTPIILNIEAVDRGGLSAFTEVKLSIENINQPPVFLNLPNGVQIAENVPAGTIIYTIAFKDPDHEDSHTFRVSYEPTIGATVFHFNSSSREVSLLDGQSLNYESVPRYTLTFELDDGELSTGEEGSVLPDPELSVLDPDGNDTTTFRIVHDTGDGIFSINSSTGVLKLLTNYYPTGTSEVFLLDIQVTDTHGSFDTAQIQVKILHSNTAPNITNLPAAIAVPESSSSGTWLYRVIVWDPDQRDTLSFHLAFSPSSGADLFHFNETTGDFSVLDGSRIDFEKQSQYTVTVVVSDASVDSEGRQLLINVTDVPEAPRFRLQTYHINTQEGEAGMVLPDPGFLVDDDDVGDSHTFSISGGEFADYFMINPVTGTLRYSLRYDLDEKILPTQPSLSISTLDSTGLSSVVRLEIVIEDVNDNAPVLDSDTYVTTLDASAPVGSDVLRVKATDADSGEHGVILFQLDQSSLDHNMFAVSNTGEIYLSSSLNQPPGGVLNFTVVAYNRQNSSQANTALVQVIVKEKPSIEITNEDNPPQAHFFDEPENVGMVVAGSLAFAAALVATSCFLARYCCRNSAEKTKVIIRSLKEITDRGDLSGIEEQEILRENADTEGRRTRTLPSLPSPPRATLSSADWSNQPSAGWSNHLPYKMDPEVSSMRRSATRLTVTSHFATSTVPPLTPADVEISSCERDFGKGCWSPWSSDDRF
ncbi:hypothetical protein ScPMuIL_009097 [Solemya velum]